MDIFFTICAFLLLVGIVVTIHESGHFFTALACKIKVLEFSIGFGPKIFQKKIGKDQILFTLRCLPLGGFVKPLDKSLLTEEQWAALPQEEKNRSFMESPRWKKALMVAGGPASNFVLAFFVFFIAATFVGNKGLPPIIGEVIPQSAFAKSGIKQGDVITQINDKKIKFLNDAHAIIANAAINGDNLNIITEDNKQHLVNFENLNLRELNDDLGSLTGVYFQGQLGDIVVKKVNEGSVAEKIGMQIGDVIISVNDVETKDLSKTLRILRMNPNKEVTLKYRRGEEIIITKATLDLQYNSGIQIGRLGVEFDVPNQNQYKVVHSSFTEGIEESYEKVISSTWTTVVSIKKLITGEISTKAISGPISIADYSGKSAQRGLYTYLVMMAAISIAVGVFNLVPIPMLDGGHLAQYAIETLRGKEFTIKQLENLQYAGIAVMTGLFTFAIINDINKYLGFLN